ALDHDLIDDVELLRRGVEAGADHRVAPDDVRLRPGGDERRRPRERHTPVGRDARGHGVAAVEGAAVLRSGEVEVPGLPGLRARLLLGGGLPAPQVVIDVAARLPERGSTGERRAQPCQRSGTTPPTPAADQTTLASEHAPLDGKLATPATRARPGTGT